MQSKAVYQTDEHGVFLYPAVAHELPLSPGQFNVPYLAVEAVPPNVDEGMVPLWNGSRWSAVEDHRQDKLYVASAGAKYQIGVSVQVDGESVTYYGIGPIPRWLTTEEPTPIASGQTIREPQE